jgi:hypothetical protein
VISLRLLGTGGIIDRYHIVPHLDQPIHKTGPQPAHIDHDQGIVILSAQTVFTGGMWGIKGE